MNVAEQTVVTITFKIFSAQNELLEDVNEPYTFLVGGQDEPLEALTQAVMGHATGFETIFQVEPHDAFGDYDPQLVQLAKTSELPSPIEVGMQFEGQVVEGERDQQPQQDHDHDEDDAEPRIYTVTQIEGDTVVLDGNHPWAGYALRISVKVLDVRVATEDELEQGYSEAPDEDDEEEAQLMRQLNVLQGGKPTLH